MSDLRTAAQQALEALELEMDTRRCKVAIAALRAALAHQAEPLNLADPAVQKRLATQWGYVPAAQAEPVEPVATLIAQRDALLEALKYLDKEFRQHGRQHWPEAVRVRAAIKSVEEGK